MTRSRVRQHQIRVFKTSAEIESLREFWNSCQPHRDADLDFYLFIANINPETLKPHVVVLYESDVPKAILVGRIDLARVPIKISYLSLPVPKIRILQIVHGGWLGEISDTSAELLVGSIIESLRLGEADAAFLHYPNFNSPLVHFARSLPGRLCTDYLIAPQYHRVQDLSRAPGAFLASLSQNERYQQRKRTRKIEQDFRNNKIEVFSAVDEVQRLICDAETVAKKSYQRDLGVGFSETTIIRSRLEFEARKGWLRAYVLYLDDQPSAFWIGSLHNRVFLSNYLAFDPIYAKYAPGMYLMIKVIKELCEELRDEHVEQIDFGGGYASYKERLSNHYWYESPVYIFSPQIKSIYINILRTAIGMTDRWAKGISQAIGILGPIKRILRAPQQRK
jgi:hypothetical protein